MAEYMDYNDYDYGYKTKRKKIFANIRLIIAIAFILFVVIWTWTHLPENVRTSFKSVYSSAHTIDETKDKKTNEFVSFNNTFNNDEKVNFDDDFKKKYPEIYALARMPKIDITKQQVKTFDIGGYFVIATTYEVNREKDSNGNYLDADKEYIIGTTGVDFYIFKYNTDKDFSIEKPKRFSIRLHAGKNDLMPYIEKVYVKSESFKLNFYSLSVVTESKTPFSEVVTVIDLESGINQKENENSFFTKQAFIKSVENQSIVKTIETLSGGERGDTTIQNRFSLQSSTAKAEIGINFDDTVYNKFEKFTIKSIKDATYTIKVN